MAVDINGKTHSIDLASKKDMGKKLPTLTTRTQAAMSNLPASQQGEIIFLKIITMIITLSRCWVI
ncbi:hypothetical protein ACOJCT_003504 [Cronobacter dublinensis]